MKNMTTIIQQLEQATADLREVHRQIKALDVGRRLQAIQAELQAAFQRGDAPAIQAHYEKLQGVAQEFEAATKLIGALLE